NLYYLASYQAQAGDNTGALETAAAITVPQYKDTALAYIAIEQARAWDVPQALRTAEGVTSEHEKSWIGREVAAVLAKLGDLKQALQIAQTIADKGMRVEALAGVVVAQAKGKDAAGAQQTLRQAIRVAQSMPADTGRFRGNPRAGAFGSIVQTQADGGDLRRAALMLDAIDEVTSKSLALMYV